MATTDYNCAWCNATMTWDDLDGTRMQGRHKCPQCSEINFTALSGSVLSTIKAPKQISMVDGTQVDKEGIN